MVMHKTVKLDRAVKEKTRRKSIALNSPIPNDKYLEQLKKSVEILVKNYLKNFPVPERLCNLSRRVSYLFLGEFSQGKAKKLLKTIEEANDFDQTILEVVNTAIQASSSYCKGNVLGVELMQLLYMHEKFKHIPKRECVSAYEGMNYTIKRTPLSILKEMRGKVREVFDLRDQERSITN